MKITKLTLENFKGAQHLSIDAQERNVTVSGQNGTGKTTVADAIVWCLTGRLTDGSTKNIKPIGDDAAVSEVSILLDDGSLIRRELAGKMIRGQFAGNQTSLYVDDVPTKPTDFKRKMQELTEGRLDVLLNPLDFLSSGRWKERRDLLIELFDGEIETPAEVAELLGKRNPDDFVAAMGTKIKKLDGLIEPLRGQIKEVTAQLKELKTEGSLDGLRAQFREAWDANAEFNATRRAAEQLQARLEAYKDHRSQTAQKLADAQANFEPELGYIPQEHELETLHAQVNSQLEYRDKLAQRLKSLERETEHICPTCGATLSAAKFGQLKDAKIRDVTDKLKLVEEGLDKLGARIEELDARIPVLRLQRLGELREEHLNALRSSLARDDADIRSIEAQSKGVQAKLDGLAPVDLSGLEDSIRALEAKARLELRLKELINQEHELNADKSVLEGQRDKVKAFVAQKAHALEASINRNFEAVSFRMRELVMTTGEYRDCCEAYVDEVPFNGGLNKGARLKAALEVMSVLQSRLGVELPLIIDDAESYTQNSFVDVPNQVWLFRVTDGGFKVEVG